MGLVRQGPLRGQRVEEHRRLAGGGVGELGTPIADKRLHDVLRVAQFLDSLGEGAQLLFGEGENAATGSIAAVACAENFRELGQGESELEGALDQIDSRQRIGRIDAISGGGARGFGEDAEALVVAQGVGADFCQPGKLRRPHRFVVFAH